jgi:hypothetical protein
MSLDLEVVQRMSRDVRAAASNLSDAEARFLVDAYYMIQGYRVAAHNQVRALSENREPNSVLTWLADQHETVENQVKGALDRYTGSTQIGEWMREIHGIGPVISAAYIAHLDIRRAPSVGHFWRFCGLDPTVKWEKGQKRPWHGGLKRICWILGESFVKHSGSEHCYYGHLFRERKELEVQKNLAGDFYEQAQMSLTGKKFREDTKALAAYKKGQLPDARIHLRAQRWAVKQFLSDLHFVWYTMEFGHNPVPPYAVAHLQHAHVRRAPHVLPFVKEPRS